MRSPPHQPHTSLLFLTPATAAGDTHSNTEGNTAADEPRRRRWRFWWGKNQTTSEVTGTEERLGYAHRLWAYARWLCDRTWRTLARRWASVFGAPAASPETWLYPLTDLFLAISSETSSFCKGKARWAALVAFALAYHHTHYTYQTPQKTPPQNAATLHSDTRLGRKHWIGWAGHQHEGYFLNVDMALGRSSCWHGLVIELRHSWHLWGWGWVLEKRDNLEVFFRSSSFSAICKPHFTHPSIVLL